MEHLLFHELEVIEVKKSNKPRNPYGQFERKSVKIIYDKKIKRLENTIKVVFANKESVSRQLRQRDEEIIKLKNIIAKNGLKTN